MRDHRTQVGLLGFILLVMIVGICFVTCDEAPVCPKDDDPPAKDYRAYFWNGINKNTLFWYHTAEGTFDSATIQWEMTENPTVSHDGSLIYIPSGDVVKVLETESLTTVEEIQYSSNGPVVVSPDGNYVAVLGDSTWVISTADYSTLFTDTAPAFQGSFSSDSKTLYTAHYNIRRISLADPNQVFSELVTDDYSIRQVIPTPDGSKLLVYFSVTTFAWAFGVFDLALDSLVDLDMQQPGNGMFSVTPDGSRAFYGNPGDPAFAGNSILTEYDVISNRVVKRINMKGLIEDFLPYDTPIGEMVISPDGRWLLAHSGPINLGQAVLRWNINQARIEPSELRIGRAAIGITIQSAE